MRRHFFGIVVAIGCGLFALAAPNASSAQTVDLEEFRDQLLAWTHALEAHGGEVTLGGETLSELVEGLDDEQLGLLNRAFENKGQLQEAIDRLTSVPPQSQSIGPKGTLVLQALTEGPFPPAYPNPDTEPSYDFILDQLESNALDPISDTNGDGNFFDERCTAEYESATWISLTTAQTADNFVGLVCDANLEPISRAACFTAAIVTLAGVLATEILVGQCELQDALVDAAEIEAGYENTVSLLLNLDEHDDDVKEQLDSIEGKVDTALVYILDAIRLLHTPEGRRTSESPGCDGGPCDFPEN